MQFDYKPYVYSIAFLLVATLLFSLLSSLLYYFSIFSSTTFQWMNIISGCFVYSIAGGILGIQMKKRALLHALPVCLLFFIISLCIGDHTLYAYVSRLAHIILFLAGCIICYVKKKH